MTNVTHLLSAIEQGDPQAAEQLLPLVYDELRKLAAQKLAQEKPGQTLQATALVHEAYLRLVGTQDPGWSSRGHFFSAAAEAMRRILVENARRKASRKHGEGWNRVDLDQIEITDINGNKYDITGKQAVSLCRCGGSVNKPFCDGTHSRIGFQAAEAAVKVGG